MFFSGMYILLYYCVCDHCRICFQYAEWFNQIPISDKKEGRKKSFCLIKIPNGLEFLVKIISVGSQ